LSICKKKKAVCASNEQYPGASHLNFSHLWLTCPSVGTVLEIFSVEKKINARTEDGSVKWLKDAKREDLEDMLVIWTGQVNEKSGTAADEEIKAHGKVFSNDNATNFVQKNWYVFFSRNDIKMNTIILYKVVLLQSLSTDI
jgi:hypothetical protein